MTFKLNLPTIVFTITFLSVFSSVYAQSTSVYGPIEIIGQKIMTLVENKSEVDAAALAEKRVASSDTARLLQDVPGVSLTGAGGISSLPAIHGMADDRVRIQVDGMVLMPSCPNHMNSPLSVVDPGSVATIQVFAGITPVSAGGDSIGGTILVSSAEPEFASDAGSVLTKGEVGTFYRSNGHGLGGNVSATYATDWFNLTYSGSFARTHNTWSSRDFKPAGLAAVDRGWLAGNEIGSTAYKTGNNELGLAARHENHLIDFKASVQHVPYELFPNQRMDMTGNNNKQLNLHYKGEYQWGDLDARVSEQITHHQM